MQQVRGRLHTAWWTLSDSLASKVSSFSIGFTLLKIASTNAWTSRVNLFGVPFFRPPVFLVAGLLCSTAW